MHLNSLFAVPGRPDAPETPGEPIAAWSSPSHSFCDLRAGQCQIDANTSYDAFMECQAVIMKCCSQCTTRCTCHIGSRYGAVVALQNGCMLVMQAVKQQLIGSSNHMAVHGCAMSSIIAAAIVSCSFTGVLPRAVVGESLPAQKRHYGGARDPWHLHGASCTGSQQLCLLTASV